MSDNVIILGAGFSHDAGIPLLGGFVERMWEIAVRKKYNGRKLNTADLAIFEDAINVKNELDTYHGRAVFDDRNIEDILSILSFNVLGGNKSDKSKLDKINRAIARTIELSCSVTHEGVPLDNKQHQGVIIETGPSIYREFWSNLFNWVEKGNKLSTLITFNYDLVLERSLLQRLIGTHYDGYRVKLPFDNFTINYFQERIPTIRYEVANATFGFEDRKPGTIVKPLDSPGLNHLEIEIIKLHGSLNFPKPRDKLEESKYNFVQSLDDPQILPPISNKMSSNKSEMMWRVALQRLRDAKNIVIVGYSLPRTDIYMQYFLKAALV